MTTSTSLSAAKSGSALMAILFVTVLGASSVFLTGLAQSQTLHDAAHDVRHTTGFPCH
ncbi:CbtB-domain containing protein [Tabrizicola sp. J26]|uniref:CbtB domain-containing protein n=1 Tax=Alitabrizicola rongguiensis TaxID=2909234 RepID=UPI001F2947DB|nr:CbtB domain-containing protein [Tabrizicola rongguiensis]MCF1710210.1 CbtB-domain containing protein [Tabrizicola rongguiensis]